MQEHVVCVICNKHFRRITRTHLLKHNTTTAEYQRQYPEASIICESLLYESGKYFRENNPMKDPECLQHFSEKRRGIPKTEEHKKKLSDAQKGEKSHMFGKKRPAHSEFMKTLVAKKKIEGTFQPPRQIPWTEERRRKTSESRKGKPIKRNPNQKSAKGIKLNLTQEQRAKRSYVMAKAIKDNKIPKSNTSIEKLFKSWCNDHNIEYEQQYMLTHKSITWLYDFYLPQFNMLVELDGEFWHQTPKQINRDKMKTRSASELGFRFLRLSSNNLLFELVFQNDTYIEQHNQTIIESRISRLEK